MAIGHEKAIWEPNDRVDVDQFHGELKDSSPDLVPDVTSSDFERPEMGPGYRLSRGLIMRRCALIQIFEKVRWRITSTV